MAKIATGQKFDRLPQGKIFGMSVTEPKSIIEQNKDAALISRKFEGILENSDKDLSCLPANATLTSRLQNYSVRIRNK